MLVRFKKKKEIEKNVFYLEGRLEKMENRKEINNQPTH